MDQNKKLKILFVAADSSGPAFHVLHTPLKYFHKFDMLTGRVVNDLNQALAEEADMVVFQRQYVPEALMYVRKAKDQGKILVTNVDDDVWHLPPNNPAKVVYTPQVLARYEQVLKEVHAVTASTPYLKKLILPFNSKCYVERNLVEPFYNEFVSPGRDLNDTNNIRIGWHLTPHHHDDYLIIENVMERINFKYPQVKWIFMGYKVPILNKMPRHRWEYYDFVPVDAFYPALASLDFDLGIAPLQNNNFNWAKTGRKAQEYAMLGIPMILSPVATYSNWKHNETCFKPDTNTSDGWFNALSYMIENKDKREELARAAYYYVLKNHDINTWIKEHSAIFYKIYNDIKGTNIPIPGYEDSAPNFLLAEKAQNIEIYNQIYGE